MFKIIADLLNGEEDLGEEMWNILHDKFMCGSLAITFAAEAVYRGLARIIAAVQKRADACYNTQQSLQTGGVLYIQNGYEAVDNIKLVKLAEARERLNQLKKRAANKIIKAQKAKDITTRKVQQAYNKAHGIVIPQGPRVKK
jgi:hypothetical protein